MDKALRSVLNWWGSMGVDVPDIRPARPKKRPSINSTKARSVEDVVPTSIAPPTLAIEALARVKTLDELYDAIRDFDAGEISDYARQAVICRGNPDAKIMIIGEAPGRDEDIQGKPFIGPAGQFLDRIIGSIGLNETNVYITNVVFWRPPNNRTPTSSEIAKCLAFTQRHIELINPDLIVLVGGVSLSALTGKSGIMKNRGEWLSLQANDRDIPALPIYHPAFLLRQPALKKDIWRDMLNLKAKMTL